jgi:hypothetical protein
MNPQRFATLAAVLCGTVVLASWTVAGLVGFDSAGLEHTDAIPIEDRSETALAIGAAPADVAQSIAIKTVSGVEADVTPALPSTMAVAVASTFVVATASATTPPADKTVDAGRSEAIVEATVPETSPTALPDQQPVDVALASPSDPVENDSPTTTAPSIEVLDECLVAEVCIDRYLWSLYQRTPKLDTIKQVERRKVTVKKNGKTRTVTKSFTKLVDEDFTWKDPKAAERAGMSLQDYVIGGMDRSFKLKLFHAMRALDDADLAPGITSGFRDDYRQGIASGLKAASNRSFHGGSLRGGYGHGLAADIVSVKGRTRAQRWLSSEQLWKWIDAHGKEFGVGRPYLDHDPPHVAPTDGQEYAAHQRGAKARHAGSAAKKGNRIAAHSTAKRPSTAKSSKVKTSLIEMNDVRKAKRL